MSSFFCQFPFAKNIKVALIIRELFICQFAYSHFKIGQKLSFSSQKWTFYLLIQEIQNDGTDQPQIMRETCTNRNCKYRKALHDTAVRKSCS